MKFILVKTLAPDGNKTWHHVSNSHTTEMSIDNQWCSEVLQKAFGQEVVMDSVAFDVSI